MISKTIQEIKIFIRMILFMDLSHSKKTKILTIASVHDLSSYAPLVSLLLCTDITILLCLANSVDTVHILFFFYTLVQTLHGICTSILCGINYLFYLPLKSPFFFTIDLNILIVIRLVIFLYNFLCTPA